jgi:ribosomal peptide maturation radical SAM protein 1
MAERWATGLRALNRHIEAALPKESQPKPVALVTAPFGPIELPSIQVGLLKAILARHGIPATVYYLNLSFARLIEFSAYSAVADVHRTLLGEWIFSEAAFGSRQDDERFFEECPDVAAVLKSIGWTRSKLLDLKRRIAPQFVRACARIIPWNRHAIVGFSSTFQQNTASFALGRAIKERCPQTKIVMGGANFDSEMGVEFARAFPWIDFAAIGEGDETFPQLVKQLLAGQEVTQQAGIAARSGASVTFSQPAPMVKDLSASPAPDYDEYFETGKRLDLFRKWDRAKFIRLPFESSRGCWWGERNHCTFCGLNGAGMKFRAKRASQVLDELRFLSERYEWSRFVAVDNIMDRDFLHGFCDALSDGKHDFDIYYEVNANMTRAEVQRLRHAGIRAFQPGIESLSTHILDLMKKGIKGIHNVELLKWAGYYGIGVSWNILTGFPGERADDVMQQAEWIKALTHLPPPMGCGPIWLERFSPYYAHSDRYPIRNIRPGKSYAHVYPPGTVDLARVAYFFDYEMGETLPSEAWEPLHEEVFQWRRKWRRKKKIPSLTYKKLFDAIVISDSRFDGAPRVYKRAGPEADFYLFCETRRSLPDCAKYMREKHGEEFAHEEYLEGATKQLIGERLMIRENQTVLSLALPENRQW